MGEHKLPQFRQPKPPQLRTTSGGILVPTGPPMKTIVVEVDAAGTGTLKASVIVPDGTSESGQKSVAMHPYEVCMILLTMIKTTMPALLQTQGGSDGQQQAAPDHQT